MTTLFLKEPFAAAFGKNWNTWIISGRLWMCLKSRALIWGANWRPSRSIRWVEGTRNGVCNPLTLKHLTQRNPWTVKSQVQQKVRKSNKKMKSWYLLQSKAWKSSLFRLRAIEATHFYPWQLLEAFAASCPWFQSTHVPSPLHTCHMSTSWILGFQTNRKSNTFG